MNVLVEVSMYPLNENYIRPIDDFLEMLGADATVEVKTNRMSTQLFGEYDAVTALVGRAMKAAHERHGGVVFVTKTIPGADRTINGYE